MTSLMQTLREGFAVEPGPNQYRCENCRGVFDKGWSDEEARAEAEATFGAELEGPGDPAVLVCDDCYKQIMAAHSSTDRK